MSLKTKPTFGEDPLYGPNPDHWWGVDTPDGDAGFWLTAPIGAQYTKRATVSSTPVVYLKTANNSADADWVVALPTASAAQSLPIPLNQWMKVSSNAIIGPVGTPNVTKQLAVPLTDVRLVSANDVVEEPYNNRKKIVDVPLTILRELTTNDIGDITANGGLLATDTTPTLETVNGDTDGELRALWATSNVDKVVFQIALPADLDITQDITIKLRAKMSGATDTPAMACESFFNEGDTKVSDSSGAFSSSLETETITIAAADIATDAAGGVLNVELYPGAHANDTLALYTVWVELLCSSAPRLEYVNGDTDSQMRLTFGAGVVTPIVFNITLPDNYDDTQDMTLKVYGDMSSTNDTPTIGIQSYFDIGDTAVVDTVSALGSTPAVDTATIAHADIPAGARNLTIEATIGAHATDTAYIYSIWLDYKEVNSPYLTVANGDTDAAPTLVWLAGDTTQVWWSGMLPSNFNGAANATMNLLGKMSSTNDTPTVTVDTWWDTGDTKITDTSSAFGDTYAVETATIALGDIPDAAALVTIKLTPGAHATDNFILAGTRLDFSVSS